MTNIFEQEFTKTFDYTDRDVGPAWFQRNAGSWELALNKGFLTGGKQLSQLKEEIMNVIHSSRETLLVCSFIIGDDELLDAIDKAVERGVRVYIITASKQRLQRNRDVDSLQEKMRLEHEMMLDRLASRALLRDAEAHAKFILADPKGYASRGVLSTANFTTEAFTHPELGIVLDDEEISLLYHIFIAAWWKLPEHELLEKGKLSAVRPLKPSIDSQLDEYLSDVGDFRITFPGRKRDLHAELLRLIRDSVGPIHISTYNISDDIPEIFSALVDAAASGKKIRLLIRPRARTTPIVEKLVRNGIEVRGLEGLHAKVLVTKTPNGYEAILMTANFEKISLYDGFEVGLLIRAKGATTLRDVLKHWWTNSQWSFELSKKYKDHIGVYRVLKDDVLEEHEIVSVHEEDLGEIQIRNLADYYSFQPEFREVNDACNVTYRWKIIPPILPSKCKPTESKDFPKLTLWKCKKGRLYISVKSEKELREVLKYEKLPNATIVYATPK